MVDYNKKLTRSRTDKYLAGVCGGIGNYFDIDSNLVRIGFMALSGLSIIVYILAAIIVPIEPVKRYLGMMVIVNGRKMTLFSSATAMDAARAYFSDTGQRVSESEVILEDVYGNQIAPDSPMFQGREIRIILKSK